MSESELGVLAEKPTNTFEQTVKTDAKSSLLVIVMYISKYNVL